MHFSGLPFRNRSTVTVVEFITVAATPSLTLTTTELILFNFTITIECQSTRPSANNSTATRSSNIPGSLATTQTIASAPFATSSTTMPSSSATSRFSVTGPPSIASSIPMTFSPSATSSTPTATSELVNKQSALATDLSIGIGLAIATAVAGFIVYFMVRSIRRARRLSAIRDPNPKVIPQTSGSYIRVRGADTDLESAMPPGLLYYANPHEIAVNQALQARSRAQDLESAVDPSSRLRVCETEQDAESMEGLSPAQISPVSCPAAFASVESLGFPEDVDEETEEGEQGVSMATAARITRVIQAPQVNGVNGKIKGRES